MMICKKIDLHMDRTKGQQKRLQGPGSQERMFIRGRVTKTDNLGEDQQTKVCQARPLTILKKRLEL